MNTDQLVLALTAPEPTQAEAVAILRKALPLAQHELTDDDDAEPQVHRIICALLHRDVDRSDVNEALYAVTLMHDVRLGIDVNRFTDDEDTPEARYALIMYAETVLNAAIHEMTFGIPKKPRTA